MSNSDEPPNDNKGSQSNVWVWVIIGGALILFFAIGKFAGSLFGV